MIGQSVVEYLYNNCILKSLLKCTAFNDMWLFVYVNLNENQFFM